MMLILGYDLNVVNIYVPMENEVPSFVPPERLS